MKLGELRQELFDDDDNDDYEVIVQLQYRKSDIDRNLTVTGVRWEHQSHEVVLEVDADD